MRTNEKAVPSSGRKIMRWMYVSLFIVMGFTGFGQMPIFKRYYLSDIPGMGWSADFYITHMIHYLGAILLLALIAYAVVDHGLSGRKRYSLTFSAYLRIVFLAGIVLTGVFRVLKNLPDVVFSPGFTMFIDLAHLAFMMLYMFTAIVLLFVRSGWVEVRAL